MKNLLYLISLIFLFSCGKESLCPTNTGETSIELRSLDDFNRISIFGDVDLFLTWDSVQSVRVECGENLQNGIITEVTNEELVIDNELKCNWIRDLGSTIRVYVNLDSLNSITNTAQGNISSLNTLEMKDFLLTCEGSISIIDLTLDVKNVDIVQSASFANITLSGNAEKIAVYNDGNGAVLAKNLNANEAFVTNKSVGKIELVSNSKLNANIHNRGNIYYSGDPSEIIFELHYPGTGSLIPF